MGAWTIREKVVDARTSAASGTATVDTLLTLGGRGLDEFTQLLVYLDVNTPLVGSAPTMDIYLQRAIVENPDATDDTHWADFMAFTQVTTSSLEEQALLPTALVTTAFQELNSVEPRKEASLGASNSLPGYWGDRIRIREKMGGTVTTQAVYDITMVGHLRIVG